MKDLKDLFKWSLGLLLSFAFSVAAFGSCGAPANPIEAENCLAGNPSSQWDTSPGSAGDPSIQGYGTDISVNAGQVINFKINTDAKAYTIDIYRMGYYGGMGARLITSIQPSAKLPQSQPACLTDATTQLIDCGNWAVSASWQVPNTATSGIYFAHLIRTDTGGDSHIVFIVRNDASHSAILFQTSDETWQAYNFWSGPSLYGDGGVFDITGRAYKVSYNRPFNTRSMDTEAVSWLFGAEYPMVRWLEANGYDVSYFTGVDAARNGSLIKNHKVYIDVGHDEYWTAQHRANVEAARDAGVNLAFFSGNEVFWKTRWENSIDGTNTPYRTLVCYKETLGASANEQILDPLDPPTWTGTWRDSTFSPPADGGKPENALTGTLFMVNGPAADNPGTLSIKVPAADGKMRFWRNTSVATQAAGQTATLPAGTLGYEWDEDIDNGSRPAGTFDLSTATYTLVTDLLLDYGATYGGGSATHHLTLHRAPSGALVFGAGTIQWSWGLDSNHDNPFNFANPTPDPDMQQATANLFADMGAFPATLQAGLVAPTKSTDATPPTSIITSPGNGGFVTTGNVVTITGTATDAGGGVIGGVEVSVDGGNTWHPASGRENWTYAWSPTALGSVTLKSRATDDSANTEVPSAGSIVSVNPPDCPCSDWNSSTTPSQVDSGDPDGGEFGVRFYADFDGYITGIRFYKASTNTGTHIGNLWSNSGTLLASAAFTNETASGWQQVTFNKPVAITAGTMYVASYFAPVGHYSVTPSYFAKPSDDAPVHFPANGTNGANGLYSYSSSSTFPTSSFQSSNYWVDVVYIPASSMPGAPPSVLVNPTALTFAAIQGNGNPPAQSVNIYNQGSGTLSWTASSNESWLLVSPVSGSTPSSLSVSVNVAGLASGTYTGAITVSSPGTSNPPQTISVTFTLTNLLLFSNFADGTMNGWAFSPLGFASNWAASKGNLQYNGGGHTQVFAGNSAWTDYSLNVAIKLATLNDFPGGIRGRMNPSTGAGYAVWLYPAQGLIKLYRNQQWNIDAGLTLIGQGLAVFDTANFHNVQLSFQGSQIRVAYDGATIITATDTTYGSGVIALDVSNQVINFTNILVTSATANTGSVTLGSGSANFSAAYQGANPAPQSVSLTGGGGGSLVWTAVSNSPWLTVSPTFGITPASLQLSSSTAGLTPGTYSGTVTVVALGAVNTTQQVAVTFTVAAPAPVLSLSASSLAFTAVGNQSLNPQVFAVTNGSQFGNFTWSAASDSSWLSASPSSGSTPQNVSVSVARGSLANGSYTGHITVTANGIANSPQTVPVTFQVLSSDMNETFSDLATGWIISPMGLGSGWSTSNGVYTYSGLGLSQSCAGNAGWSDYRFDTNVQLSNLANYPGGIRARVNPSTGAGYAVWLYPGYGKAVLYGVPQWNINGPGLTQLASANMVFDTASHDLGIDFFGNTISVSWDGVVIMTAADSSYAAGMVCFDADSQPIAYSNVKVSAVQNQVALDPINPSSLVFNAQPGNSPAPQTLNVTAGGVNTTWAASSTTPWIALSASTTVTPGVLSVSVNSSTLSEGTYTGSITLSAPGATNSPVTIPVTLAIKTAVLSVTPSPLTFFGAVGLNPNAQSLQIANVGTGTLNWTASKTNSWLGLSSTSGTAPATVTVSPSTATTGAGTFTDTISVASADVGNSPVNVPVTMQVGSLLFSDNFSTVPDGNWTVGPLGFASGWSIVNGAYTYNGAGNTESYAGSSAWTDYTVVTDFQLSSLNDFPGGLRGRFNTTTGASYGVWIYPAEKLLRLYRIGQWDINADLSLLGQSAPINIDTNWHNLRLVFQGATIQVYYDNALAITATDSTYTQGAVALDVSNQPISFDNVTVISLP